MSPAAVAGATVSRPVVQVGGQELAPAVVAALRRTVVDSDAKGPDCCRLTFDDPARDLLSGSGMDLAKELVVTAGRVGDESMETLFDGIVYAVGFEFDDRGAFTVVTAYDRSYALFNGTHTASYQNMTDSDIAKQVAGDLRLSVGRIDGTTVIHDHVSQINESHFDFLTRRATEVDCLIQVRGKEFFFIKSETASGAPDPGDLDAQGRLQLVPGSNVQRLSVRVTGSQQVKEVEVRGWDPQNKEALSATASTATRSASLADTPATAAQAFDGGTYVQVGLPLTRQAECDAAAAALAERIGGSNVHVEGVALGDPQIVAGAPVSLGGTGGRFDGKVTVTRARHVWDGTGYRTTFVASGANDRTLLRLVLPATEPDRVSGVAPALVTNVDDPDGGGRVKLKLPWLDDGYETDWARVMQLGAGKDRGLSLLPEVDDEVLVAFEQGDTRRPYVVGGLYNGMDAPPDGATSSGSVVKRLWRSRTGHEILLDDTDGSEQVVITTGSGKVTVTLDGSSGDVKVSGEGNLTISAGGGLKLEARGGDLTLEASGNAKVKAGASMGLEASADLTVKGAVIKLN